MKKSGLIIGFILLLSMFATLEFEEVKGEEFRTLNDCTSAPLDTIRYLCDGEVSWGSGLSCSGTLITQRRSCSTVYGSCLGTNTWQSYAYPLDAVASGEGPTYAESTFTWIPNKGISEIKYKFTINGEGPYKVYIVYDTTKQPIGEYSGSKTLEGSIPLPQAQTSVVVGLRVESNKYFSFELPLNINIVTQTQQTGQLKTNKDCYTNGEDVMVILKSPVQSNEYTVEVQGEVTHQGIIKAEPLGTGSSRTHTFYIKGIQSIDNKDKIASVVVKVNNGNPITQDISISEKCGNLACSLATGTIIKVTNMVDMGVIYPSGKDQVRWFTQTESCGTFQASGPRTRADAILYVGESIYMAYKAGIPKGKATITIFDVETNLSITVNVDIQDNKTITINWNDYSKVDPYATTCNQEGQNVQNTLSQIGKAACIEKCSVCSQELMKVGMSGTLSSSDILTKCPVCVGSPGLEGITPTCPEGQVLSATGVCIKSCPEGQSLNKDGECRPTECVDCTVFTKSVGPVTWCDIPAICKEYCDCTGDIGGTGIGGTSVDKPKASGSYSGGKRTDTTLPKVVNNTTPIGPDVPAWIKVTNTGCTHLTKDDTLYLVWVIPRSDGKNVVYEMSTKYDDILNRWEFKDAVGKSFKLPKNYPINFGFDFVSASGQCTDIKYDRVITFTGDDMFANTVEVDMYADEDKTDYVPMKITFTNSACGEDWVNDIRLGRKPTVTARWIYAIPSRPGMEMTRTRTVSFGNFEDYISELVPKDAEIKFEFDYNSPTCGGENGIQTTHKFTGSTLAENTWQVDLGNVGLSKDTVPFKITIRNSECSFWDENRYTEGKSSYVYNGTDTKYIGKTIVRDFGLIKGVQSKTWTYDVGRVQKNTPVTFTIKYDNTKCGGVQEKTFTRTFTGDTLAANDITVDIGSELDTGFTIRGTDSTRSSGYRRSIGLDILTKDGQLVDDDKIIDVASTDFTKNYVDIAALGLAPGTYTAKAFYYVQPLFGDVIVKSHTFDGVNSIVVTANNIVNINHDFANDPVESSVLITFVLTNSKDPSFRWQDHTVTASGQRVENGVKVAYFSEKTYTDIGTNGVRWPNLNMNPTDPSLPVGGNWVFFITLDGEQRVFWRPVTQADINNGIITLDWGFINNTGGIKVTASDSSRQFNLSTYRKTLAIDIRYPGKTTGPGIYVPGRDIEPTFSLSDNYAINEIRNIPIGNWDVRTTLNIETTSGIVSKEYTFTDVLVRNSEMTELEHDYTDEAELDKLWVDISLVNSDDLLFDMKKHTVKVSAERYSCTAYDQNPEDCTKEAVVPLDEYTDVSSVKWDNVELSVGYWIFDVTLDGQNRKIRWWVTQTDEENGIEIDFAKCLPSFKITIMDSKAPQDTREYQYTVNMASSSWSVASEDGEFEAKKADGTIYDCDDQDTCMIKTVNKNSPKYTFDVKWNPRGIVGQRDICVYDSFQLTMSMTQVETIEGESSIQYIFPWDIDTRKTAFQISGAYGECEYIFDMNGGEGVILTAEGIGCGGWNDEDPALLPYELQGVVEWVETYLVLRTPVECMPGHTDIHDTKVKLWWDDRGKTIYAPEFINGNWYWEGEQVDSMGNTMLIDLPDAPIGGWTLFRYYDPGLPKGKTINYEVTWGTYTKTGTFKVDRISTEEDPIIVEVSCEAVGDMNLLEKIAYRLTKYADAIVGLFVIGAICGLLGLIGYLVKLGKGGLELFAGIAVGIVVIVGGVLLLVLAPEEVADVVAIPLRGVMDFIYYVLSGV